MEQQTVELAWKFGVMGIMIFYAICALYGYSKVKQREREGSK